MPTPDISSMIASPGYFDAVIAGAREAGLVLLGRTMIDSNTHALRRPVNVRGTDIPTIWYLRMTTLIFHVPGKAIFIAATYNEEIETDYPKAHQGIVEVSLRHPYWQLTLFLGLRSGMSWLHESEQGKWLFIDQQFSGADIRVTTSVNGTSTSQSAFPYRPDEDMFDGKYGITLGYYPTSATPDVFKAAMMNLLQGIEPYVRDGELSKRHDFGNIAPWEDFVSCNVSFWEQVGSTFLAGVFEEETKFDPERAQRSQDQI